MKNYQGRITLLGSDGNRYTFEVWPYALPKQTLDAPTMTTTHALRTADGRRALPMGDDWYRIEGTQVQVTYRPGMPLVN
jgi:hypothetical protein